MPAKPRGLGCFFQRKIESFSGGWRTDDVVRLLTETVKATNLFVEIFITSKCGIEVVQKFLLRVVPFHRQAVLQGNASYAIGNPKRRFVGGQGTVFVAEVPRADKGFVNRNIRGQILG